VIPKAKTFHCKLSFRKMTRALAFHLMVRISSVRTSEAKYRLHQKEAIQIPNIRHMKGNKNHESCLNQHVE